MSNDLPWVAPMVRTHLTREVRRTLEGALAGGARWIGWDLARDVPRFRVKARCVPRVEMRAGMVAVGREVPGDREPTGLDYRAG